MWLHLEALSAWLVMIWWVLLHLPHFATVCLHVWKSTQSCFIRWRLPGCCNYRQCVAGKDVFFFKRLSFVPRRASSGAQLVKRHSKLLMLGENSEVWWILTLRCDVDKNKKKSRFNLKRLRVLSMASAASTASTVQVKWQRFHSWTDQTLDLKTQFLPRMRNTTAWSKLEQGDPPSKITLKWKNI